MDVTIEQITKMEAGLTRAINDLASLLGDGRSSLADTDVLEMLGSPEVRFFIAREKYKIVGMLTLLVYRIPFTKKGILEDLVVMPEFRQQGLGKRLIQVAIDTAKENGASYIDITSRPSRAAANILYERFGFKKRETNVYRLQL